MPKIVGTRERVHQPFYDSLIRVDGSSDLRSGNQGVFQALNGRTQLFTRQGSDIAVCNLTTGSTFPSDQTFITLAIRVWTYFRFNAESTRTVAPGTNYMGQLPGNVAPVGAMGGVTVDRVQRVHKLYYQAENQLFWQFFAGDKPQITTFTAYTPFAGGIDGYFADSRLYVANNGEPTSSALMRLARPILIPPRQGFQVVCQESSIGQAVGANFVDQANGLVPNNDGWGPITGGTTGTVTAGFVNQTTDVGLLAHSGAGLSVAGADDIEKDVKYLLDGLHSRDVL
jgi:hypothetical protein